MPVDFGIGTLGQGELPSSSAGGVDFGASGEGQNLPALHQPSIIERIAGGTLTGARRHFLLKPVINRIAGSIPGVGTETLDRMEARLEGSRLSDVFEFVGEFGPDLAAGFGIFGLGRAAAVRALAWTGRTAVGGRLLPAATRTAARLAPEAVGGTPIAKPLLERGAEIVGGSVGLGGYSGVQTLAEGGSLDDAGRAALTTAALVGGAEVGMAAIFGRITRARQVDVGKVEELFEKGGRKVILSEADKVTTRIGRINQRIEKANGRVEQELELATARLAEARAQPKLPGFEPQLGSSEMALERAFLKAEERANKFYDDLLPKWEQRVKRLEARQGAWEGLLKSDPGGAIYTRNVPFNPKGVRLMYEQMALRIMHTPEAMRGELGPAFARVFKQLDTAETMTIIARSHNEALVGKLAERAQKALGLSNRQVRKDRAVFLPVFKAWEEGGEQGVRDFMAQAGRSAHADDILGVFGEADNAMMRIYHPLADMGAEPVLSPDLLRQLGVQKYLPHLLDDLPEDQIMDALARKMGDARAATMWDAFQRDGLGKFSSIDFNRVRAGSLANKVADGLPYDPNPFNNLFRYLNSAHRRYEYGSRFGMAGELKEGMVAAVSKEGGRGAGILANSILDVPLGRTFYPQAMRQLSRIALGTQIASKLTLAVIPNMSQPVNAILWGGIRNFSKGLTKAVQGEGRDEILGSVALMESVIRSTGRAFGEARIGPALVEGRAVERLAHASDKLAYWTLTKTGFSLVERWNRLLSGTTGLYMFRDTLAKAVAGRLRGNSLDLARRRFEHMGANLDSLVQKVRAGGSNYLKGAEFRQAEMMATFKAAQQTQFIPSLTRRPLYWNHPIGRVFTQFKTFALGQGRFIRDQVFAEAARGNLKPMAYFLSIYPVAGEVVGELRSVARGKPREQEGVTRFLGDISMVGGIGLFTDTFVAAKYGRLSEVLLGPTIGEAINFAERMTQRDVEGVYKNVMRQPAAQATKTLMAVGILTTQALDDYLEEFPNFQSEGASGSTAIDFGLARHREIQKKTQPQP